MRGYVQEDLLEARRRTVLHSRVRKPATQDDLMRSYDGHLHLSEAEHAESQPSGAIAGWGLLVVCLLGVAVFAGLLVWVLR